MLDILNECQRVLSEAGILSWEDTIPDRRFVVFESPTIIGFVLVYPTAIELRSNWISETTSIVSKYQFALRRAERKAWNTYTILLTKSNATPTEKILLAELEEDLSGTRKITRAEVTSTEHLRAALLPLLPIQSGPRLQAVDMPSEIKKRTPELPSEAVEAFLTQGPIAVVSKLLEEN